MSVVQTTAGIFGINGSLNVQSTLTANEVDVSVLKLNGVDVTTALQGEAQVSTYVTNIISGSQVVGNATNSVNVALNNDTTDNFGYIPFSISATGNSSLKTNANLMYYSALNLLSLTGTSNFQSAAISSNNYSCLLYTSPSPRDRQKSRMPSSA